MSKRHQSSRRKAYGRRQHELHERQSRGLLAAEPYEPYETAAESAVLGLGSPIDPFAYAEARAPRLRFALGD